MRSLDEKRLILLILVFILAAFMLIAAGCTEDTATPASNEEILASWTKNSESKALLIEYVQDVTDKASADFIPAEDRIAVFDMDGTFLCEGNISETVLGVAVTLYRCEELKAAGKINEGGALYDNYQALQQQLAEDPTLGKYGADLLYAVMGGAFAGMPIEEYVSYVTAFMTTQHPDLDIKWADAFYRPMIELINYLEDNNFTVYIVSGTDRQTVWGANQGVIDLPRSQMIGTDINLYGSTQIQDSYEFAVADELLRQRTYYGYNFDNAKVFNIYRQIGKKPVMAFGNSSGDYPMINFTLSNDYRTFAGLLIHDDAQREYEYNVDTSLAACEDNSWTPISIKDDFSALWLNQ